MVQDFTFAVWRLLKALGFATWIFASSMPCIAQVPAAQNSLVLPSDLEIRKILAERVGTQENDIGIIVGMIEPQGQRIISYGHRNAGDSRPLDGDTVFEI